MVWTCGVVHTYPRFPAAVASASTEPLRVVVDGLGGVSVASCGLGPPGVR